MRARTTKKLTKDGCNVIEASQPINVIKKGPKKPKKPKKKK